MFPIHESLHWYLIAFCDIGSVLANVVNKPGTNVDDHALIFVMDSLPKKLNYYKRNIMNLCSYLSLEYLAKKMNTLQVATTGVGFQELNEALKKEINDFLENCDVLIDGRYEENNPSKYRWVGSGNQKIYFFSGRHNLSEFTGDNTVEIRFDGKTLSVNGWPSLF